MNLKLKEYMNQGKSFYFLFDPKRNKNKAKKTDNNKKKPKTEN